VAHECHGGCYLHQLGKTTRITSSTTPGQSSIHESKVERSMRCLRWCGCRFRAVGGVQPQSENGRRGPIANRSAAFVFRQQDGAARRPNFSRSTTIKKKIEKNRSRIA